MKKIQAVFLDRDGTIGGSTVVHLPCEFKLYDNAIKAINILKQKRIKMFSFTNQPDISRGKCKKEEFEKELLGFGFNQVYLCPHIHEEKCECRKPNTKMLEQAAKDHDLNLKQCVVFGDRWSDMLAAARVGAIMVLVKTGAGNDAITKYRHKWEEYQPHYIAEDILDGVKWLEKNSLV